MLNSIRNNRYAKLLMIFLAMNILFNNLFMSNVFANGPSQPEMQGPSGSSVENMVDPFTGDFNYSVPLFEMGDIPLSLNYNGSISMEQEASWVGLGWSLNPGSINRTVRGLPDDNFQDKIVDKQHIRPNETVGVTIGAQTEIAGMDFAQQSAKLNLTFNNYTGFDLGLSISPSISAGEHADLGLTMGSQSSNDFGDIGITPSYSFGKTVGHANDDEDDVETGNTLGVSFSTQKGLQEMSFSQTKTVGRIIDGKVVANKDEDGNDIKGSLNVGAKTSNLFNDQSYSPGIKHSFKNYQFSFRAGLGFNATVVDQSLFIDGYYSAQFVDDEEVAKASYGYLYADNASGDVLLDFNRESDGQLQENTPVLSPSYMTYDIFSISSPGLSGTFRAYRNDIGYVEENDITGSSTSASFGAEFSIGNVTSPGLDISATFGGSNNTEWTEGNEIDDLLAYSNKKSNGITKEQFYFAMMDEVTAESDPGFVSNIGGKQPIEFNVNGQGVSTTLGAKYDTYSASNDIALVSGEEARSSRKTRNVDITYMTIREKQQLHPIQRHAAYNDLNSMHIGQIMVTNSDGTRYIYGLPAYNLEQTEVSFNIGKSGKDDPAAAPDANNFVPYENKQRGLMNESGVDHYYKETTTNEFSYAFLLTEILSPDYVDVTGDGPTADDLGNYVRYTYGVDPDENGVYEVNIPAYKWRTPITKTDFLANHFEGFKSDASDDKANFVYGTKEIWYLNKIETKDYTASFNTSARRDGYEVLGPDGGVSNVQLLQKLDNVELFSNAELQALGEDAVPIKTVIFTYNNELCQFYPLNNSGDTGQEGKLTLLSVSFKYNNSNKARFSYYKFGYESTISADDAFENPEYGFTANDRWGNYKPEAITGVKNKDFPYVNQADVNNNYYASAWCLKKITTPTNGVIEVTYEGDDYAYVQDQQATQMVNVLGALASPGAPDAEDNLLFDYVDDDGEVGSTNYNCIIFEVPDLPDGIDPDLYVKQAYILGDDLDPYNPNGVAKNFYFKFSLNTNKQDFEGTEGYDYEYISGYAELDLEEHPNDYAGVETIGGVNYGYVRLKPESARFKNVLVPYDRDVNPITKTGWQFCMEYVKYNILDQSPPGEPGDETFIQAMADVLFVSTIMDFFRGPNNKMRKQGYANQFEPEKSWIRLQNPTGHKIGGGNRVKSIQISDKWETMTDLEDGYYYGQEYNYNLEDGRSSGVAAYEPAMGGDENPLKKPFWFNHDPDKSYRYKMYKEKPFGENYFPAPVVGYSRVEVKNIERTNVKRTATGNVVNEFFTAKDFPVRITYTSLDPVVFKPEPVLSIFKVASINSYTGSQGFCIETNNMHGKPKSVKVFAEDQVEPLSKTEYHYKRDGETGHLNNWVKVINADASIPTANVELGVTYDLTLDFRKATNWSAGGPIKVGLDAFFTPVPFAIPSAIAQFNYSSHTTKLAVATKVVNTNALIDYVETTQDGSTVKQYNNLYDSQTGAPIITSTQNEFNDNYYSATYPAHWAIKGMDMACDNNGFMFQSENTSDKIDWSTGRIIDANIASILAPGDEVGIVGKNVAWSELVAYGNSAVYCWVYEVKTGPATLGYYLINRDGTVPNFAAIASDFDDTWVEGVIQATVYRSGKRNQASNPIQSFVSKNDPVLNGFPLTVDEDMAIISSSAIDYAQVWQKTCVPLSESEDTYCVCTETSTGQQFMDLLDDFLHTSFVYDPITSWPSDDNQILYNRSAEGETYFHTFTSELMGLISLYSIASEFTTVMQVEAPTEAEETDLDYLHLQILHNGIDPVCDFELQFGDGSPLIDLSDETLFNDIFGNPEELSIDFNITPAGCADVNQFTMTLNYINDAGVPVSIDVNVSGYSDDIGCLTYSDCNTYTLEANYCSGDIDETVNPYVKGLLGIWYPNIEYAFLTDRNPIAYSGVEDIELRTNGIFEKYKPFWKWNTISEVWEKDDTDWVWTVKSSLRDPSIGQLQAINALAIPSSTIFGHNKTITEMIADNASYKTIGYENFEDNEYIGILEKECHEEHFDFSILPGVLTERFAHSGNFSMRIPYGASGNVVTLSSPLTETIDDLRSTYPQPFKIIPEDCIPAFEPEASSSNAVTYLLTFWAKQEFNNTSPIFDYTGINAAVKLGATTLTVSTAKSKIIEGWQRFECEFTIPASSSGTLNISLTNSASEKYVYVDDIRIMPKVAMAKCYVFDYKTQWLMAELDENHYATFYEYDEDGKLIRVKKETEKGIMTIQEGRYFSIKRAH